MNIKIKSLFKRLKLKFFPKTSVELIADEFSERELNFQYLMLGRLKNDCEYYINESPHALHLWMQDEQGHIDLMKEMYNRFSEKPSWITLEDIQNYEKQMLQLKGK